MALTAIVVPINSQFTNYNGEPIASFEDDSVYKVLQPFFERMLPDIPIDPYDGGTINGHALVQFVNLLENAKDQIHAKPSKWLVQTFSWTQGDKHYNREIIANRDQVLNVIYKLIELAKVAILNNQMVLFIGD